MSEIAAILQQLTDKAMLLAPEVIEGLVKIQAAKFALYTALWWKLLLASFGLTLIAGLCFAKADDDNLWGGLGASLVAIVFIVGMVAVALLIASLGKSVFEAAPEIYVLRNLL